MPLGVKVFDGRSLSAPVVLELQQRGVSAAGARQFLNGEIVSGLGDRRQLVRIISRELGLPATEAVSLPYFQTAVLTVRDRTMKSGTARLSDSGAHQFLAGVTVANKSDRQSLAELCYAVINPQSSATKDMVLKGKKILEN